MKQDFLAELGYLALVMRLKRISDAMIHEGRSLYRELDLDIEPNWFAIFKLINEKGPLTITEIADCLGFSHPSVVAIVNKMIKTGYLDSIKSEEDSRKRILTLSKRAERELPKLELVWEAGVSSVKRMLPEIDILGVLDAIEKAHAERGFKARTLDDYEKMSKVSVVPFRKELGKSFADLNFEWIEKSYKVEQHDREQLLDPEGYVLSKKGEIFFALIENVPVGTVAMIPIKEESVELAKMAVTPEYRGFGIANRLIESCIEFAKEREFKSIILESNRKQIAAIRLYRKYGFVEVALDENSEYARADIRMELKTKN